MALPVYATPRLFWALTAPPDTLFQDSTFEGGTWTDVTKTGVGSGGVDVDIASNPRDDFNVVVRCVLTGELNLYGVLNPGPFPRFIISLDGGSRFSRPLEADSAGQLRYQLGGFSLNFTSGTPTPSFVAGDEYRFQTTVSTDILLLLESSSRKMDPYIGNTRRLPLLSWGLDVSRVCCELSLWSAILRRGLDNGQDFKVYYPKEAYEWLDKVSNGLIDIDVQETPPAVYFPDFVPTRPPYKTDWRF